MRRWLRGGALGFFVVGDVSGDGEAVVGVGGSGAVAVVAGRVVVDAVVGCVVGVVLVLVVLVFFVFVRVVVR